MNNIKIVDRFKTVDRQFRQVKIVHKLFITKGLTCSTNVYRIPIVVVFICEIY